MILVEFQFRVEAGAVGRHQINAFNPGDILVTQKHGHQFGTQTLTLVFGGHHHIPEHCPINTITCSTAKSNQIGTTPGTHHSLAAGQHPSQILDTASLSPEAVSVEQGL